MAGSVKSDVETLDFACDGLSRIDRAALPRHVAIIMDGNGRWGKKYGFARVIGHREGVETVRMVVETTQEIGIKHLSLFAFSTDNIFRPLTEVSSLFGLFEEILAVETNKLHKKNIRIMVSGDLTILPEPIERQFRYAENLTKDNNSMILNIAVNYSGRQEIVDAVRKIVKSVLDGEIKLEELSEEFFRNYLYYPRLP